ncbi:hypothetical protein [Streptomyces sp. LNU-CPARS28]|uniref:hypothetical protein n=1 Tax=Streptomyces sp. LNU-CPARS28 TaxID=3137371 RepID=UPI0031365A96
MYPTLFTTPGLAKLTEEIDAERQRQIAKFGEQHHPDGTGGSGALYVADRYRTVVDRGLEAGTATWRDVVLEEVFEALAESDPTRLRAELIQVAAVCAAWVADIDSRTPAEEPPAACRKCRQPFDPADTRFDGHARHGLTPYCRRCVDACHDNEIADHRCVICA